MKYKIKAVFIKLIYRADGRTTTGDPPTFSYCLVYHAFFNAHKWMNNIV